MSDLGVEFVDPRLQVLEVFLHLKYQILTFFIFIVESVSQRLDAKSFKVVHLALDFGNFHRFLVFERLEALA